MLVFSSVYMRSSESGTMRRVSLLPVSEERAIFKAQDIQDNLILEDGIERLYSDVDNKRHIDAP